MPRTPTGNPRGRPKGSGRLTPTQAIEEAQSRITIRLPTVLYDRLEAFAAGRHFHRGSPQLARCVREALEEYLERHSKRQTENIPLPGVDNNRQTINDAATAVDNNRQTKNAVQAPGKATAPQGSGHAPLPSTKGGSARRTPQGTLRQRIITLLSEQSEGLNAEEIRVHLKADKPIGDTLQGMRRAGIIKTRGTGRAMRYVVA